MPEISVVIPVFNTEKYLKEAINSVIQQTFTNWELLLVDDGSEDSCPAICEDYSARFASIHSLRISHSGVSAARNAGLEKAVGKWILFLDSDDLLEKHALEIMHKKADGCGAVSCGVKLFGEGLPPKDFTPGTDYSFDSYQDTLPMAKELMRLYFNGIIVNKLLRRDRLHNKFDVFCQSGEDTLFALRTLPEMGKIRIIKEVLYHYRLYPEVSLSKTFHLSQLETYERVFYAYMDSYRHKAEAALNAATDFAISAIRYFDSLINTEEMPPELAKILVISQLDSCSLLQKTDLLRQAEIQNPKNKAMWDALLSHDAEKIYNVFFRE